MGELTRDAITVLDLSDEATVFAGKLLGELGATVVHVEDAAGDAIRCRPPYLGDKPGLERSLAHLLYNANKRSVALNLQAERAPGVVERMAANVEVVIAPLTKWPGLEAVLARLEQLPGGPGIVDVVFRRDAPAEVATDLVATAAGGLLVLNGHPDDPPAYPAGQLAYKQASLAAAEAALALVMERRATGHAGRITISLQEAVNWTTIQTSNAGWWLWQGRVPSRRTPLSAFTTYRAGDGRWVSFTVHPPNWPRYAEWVETALGSSELSGPEWMDAGYRVQKVAHIAAFTEALCRRYGRDELIAEGQGRGLLVLPVNSIAGIAEDPHLREREFFEQVWHPQLGEAVTLPRTAFLSGEPRRPSLPAPALGAHTGHYLRELGMMTEAEVEALFAAGVAHGDRGVPQARGESWRPARPRSPVAEARPPRQPLRGVRVLDFCWAVAGPLTTRLLADLGADVIKVESEFRVDPIRQIGVQPRGEASWNTNGQFNDCNTNKRAMTLNLNTPEGIEVARALAATADVVTSNYTPDRLDRWGLGYDALRELNPRVIVANMAVMGTWGPNKDWRSYGSGIVAMCGLAELTGFPGRDPIGLGTLHTDFTVPYFGAAQIMAALIRRDDTGKGALLELSQYEASVHLLDTELVEFMNRGAERTRRGNASSRFVPHGVFPSAGDDRWIAVACRDDSDWERLCEATGLRFARGFDRFARVPEVDSAVGEWTAGRDNWGAAALLQAAGVPASPVEDLRDLLERDPGMAGAYRRLDLPSGVAATVQEEPITWDGERLPLVRAPLWAEHTEEVLRQELGLDDEAIAELAMKGVLF